MLKRLRDSFRSWLQLTPRIEPRPTDYRCPACEVYKSYVEGLKEQVEDLRQEREHLMDSLFKVARIPVVEAQQQDKPHVDPIQTRASKPWSTIRRELELKYKKKPEDQVADYWEKKAADMEAQAGFNSTNLDVNSSVGGNFNKDKEDASEVG